MAWQRTLCLRADLSPFRRVPRHSKSPKLDRWRRLGSAGLLCSRLWFSVHFVPTRPTDFAGGAEEKGGGVLTVACYSSLDHDSNSNLSPFCIVYFFLLSKMCVGMMCFRPAVVLNITMIASHFGGALVGGRLAFRCIAFEFIELAAGCHWNELVTPNERGKW